jgi:two-component system phosphate regulon response regulator PhoB
MPETIFIVEDDADIARLLRVNLENAGYVVHTFTHGFQAWEEALVHPPVLFLLDIMLPGGEDGLSLCKRIRQEPRFSSSRVIFITAKMSELDRVLGLEIGGDEYITKPFSPRELVARVRAVLRWRQETHAPPELHFGDLEIDTAGMVVRRGGKPLVTTTTEFRILQTLASSPGRVISRARLLELVWGNTEVDPRSVDVYVCRLRGKIESNPDDPMFLHTVRGVGYRFGQPGANKSKSRTV